MPQAQRIPRETSSTQLVTVTCQLLFNAANTVYPQRNLQYSAGHSHMPVGHHAIGKQKQGRRNTAAINWLSSHSGRYKSQLGRQNRSAVLSIVGTTSFLMRDKRDYLTVKVIRNVDDSLEAT